jgi:hypothetical protein
MSEQMVDTIEKAGAIIDAEDAITTEDKIIQLQALPLDQGEDRNRGDRFAHAADPKQIGGSRAFGLLLIRPSERLPINELSVSRDRHREPWNLVTVHEGPNQLFHRREPRLGGRWLRVITETEGWQTQEGGERTYRCQCDLLERRATSDKDGQLTLLRLNVGSAVCGG